MVVEYENIVPLWYEAINKVKLPKNLEIYRPDSKFEDIIRDVDLSKLINLLSCGNRELSQERSLYNYGFKKEKTTKILELWKSGHKTLPASICYIQETNSLVISDGRHRINAANYFGQKTIPIVVFRDEVIIKLLINIDLIEKVRV